MSGLAMSTPAISSVYVQSCNIRHPCFYGQTWSAVTAVHHIANTQPECSAFLSYTLISLVRPWRFTSSSAQVFDMCNLKVADRLHFVCSLFKLLFGFLYCTEHRNLRKRYFTKYFCCGTEPLTNVGRQTQQTPKSKDRGSFENLRRTKLPFLSVSSFSFLPSYSLPSRFLPFPTFFSLSFLSSRPPRSS